MECATGSYLLMSLNKDINQLKSNPGKKKSGGQLCCQTGTKVGRKEGQECVVSGSSTDFECKTASSVKRVTTSKTAKQRRLLLRTSKEKELGAWNIF